MKPEEVYSIWAPADSIWSPWVLPVAFAQLNCADFSGVANGADLHRDIGWMPDGGAAGLAVIADLPGEKAIQYGLALAAWNEARSRDRRVPRCGRVLFESRFAADSYASFAAKSGGGYERIAAHALRGRKCLAENRVSRSSLAGILARFATHDRA